MRKHLFAIDWWLLGPVIVLIIMSLTTLFSLSPDLFKEQLLSLVIASIFFFVFANIRYEVFKPLSLPIYIGSLIAFGVVLLLGYESHGAVRWLQLFGATIQFSEVCKPLLALALAGFLSSRENTKVKNLLFVLLLLVPVIAVIYLQPDLGNAIIYLFVVTFVLVVYGFRIRWFALCLVPLLISLPVIWTKLHDYQRQRILTFLHPSSDQSGASYNAIQALIAVGSGMFWGRGLSEGTQSGLRFLPERHTDFIFASMTEELGFIGGIIVLVAFSVLLYRIYCIFRSAEDPYAKIFAACAFGFILIHTFLNIGMNVGLVPIVGVTLPFVSFGGSSLLANTILLGVLTAMSNTLRQGKVLEIK